MKIFVALLFSIVILFFLFYTNKSKSKNILYCIIIALLLFVVAAFRSEECGLMDTKTVYMYEFYNIQQETFTYILMNYKDVIFFILMINKYLTIIQNRFFVDYQSKDRSIQKKQLC